MKRDLVELTSKEFDLLIIGGGIYGVFVAWDAALRGLSVALVEKGDFGHATSSNTLRIIHGGLRYLQHGNIHRMRRSITERTAFMRMAPHLVHPLPFLIPTYGHWQESKALVSLALYLSDVIGFDRNRLADPQKHLPRGRILSREECRRLVPGVSERGLTGALLYYDCQMYDSERLILAVARSAARAGAVLANYVKASKFLRNGSRVSGITAKDDLWGDTFEIRAKSVVNTSGPWLGRVLGLLNGDRPSRTLSLSKAFNLLVRRQIVPDYALGVYSRAHVTGHAGRRNTGRTWVFITPWRCQSLIGTAHLPFDGDPDACTVTEQEIDQFIKTVNEAYPAAGLHRHDVQAVYSGLLPMIPDSGGNGTVRLITRHAIHDHQQEDGIESLASVVGVKFTEARYVAERTVDLVFRKLGRNPPRAVTAFTPVLGGNIEYFDDFMAQQIKHRPNGVTAETMQSLIYRYGSQVSEVLKCLGERRSVELLSCVTKAEIIHAIRAEMAQTLSDVVFRRTGLVTDGDLKDGWLHTCADIMAAEIGWDRVRAERNLQETKSRLKYMSVSC